MTGRVAVEVWVGLPRDIRIHKRGVTLTHRYHETVGHYFRPMMGRDSRNILYVRTVPRFGVVWRRAHARRDSARDPMVGEHGAQTHATGYLYAPLPRPAATCARTPRWLISSQISLLDCGAVVDGPCQPLSPFFHLSPSLLIDSPVLSVSPPFSLFASLARAHFSTNVASLSGCAALYGQCDHHAIVPRGHTRPTRNIIVTQLSIVNDVKWRREAGILLMIVVRARNLNRPGSDSPPGLRVIVYRAFSFLLFLFSL